jgi:hypothetical protein
MQGNVCGYRNLSQYGLGSCHPCNLGVVKHGETERNDFLLHDVTPILTHGGGGEVKLSP